MVLLPSIVLTLCQGNQTKHLLWHMRASPRASAGSGGFAGSSGAAPMRCHLVSRQPALP